MIIRKYFLHCSFFILLFIYPFCAQAQRGTISYKLIIDNKKLGRKTEQNLIIYFDRLSSTQLVVKPKNPGGDIPTDELNQVKVLKSGKPTFVFKDFSRKTLLYSDYIGIKKMLITDTLNNFKWKITNEKRKIGRLNCRKATTNFRGNFYLVWYAEDIPLQNGPWKFCGLPGLIVSVKDAKSDFDYELTNINFRAKFDNKLIGVPAAYGKDKTITYKEYRTLYKKKLEDYIRLSRVELTTPDGAKGMATINLPEKQEKL